MPQIVVPDRAAEIAEDPAFVGGPATAYRESLGVGLPVGTVEGFVELFVSRGSVLIACRFAEMGGAQRKS